MKYVLVKKRHLYNQDLYTFLNYYSHYLFLLSNLTISKALKYFKV